MDTGRWGFRLFVGGAGTGFVSLALAAVLDAASSFQASVVQVSPYVQSVVIPALGDLVLGLALASFLALAAGAVVMGSAPAPPPVPSAPAPRFAKVARRTAPSKARTRQAA